ncbi:Crp/Fnr family transcriptional regulator [Algoriphagus confluentis]|uniref:Crp/Fnr family transcriptional regulator n=1 Tax=Algoriphagus confluentis TaxID=1697556 RepID=UPI0030C750CE
MRELAQYIKNHVPGVGDELLPDIEENFRIRFLGKGEHLIREGEVCKNVYFVKKGFLRNYVLKDGKDNTVWFFFPSDFLTVFDSLQLKSPGRENTEALSDSELYWISLENLEALNLKSHTWERISRLFTIQFALQQQARLFMFQTMNAEEKYEYLCENFPKIIQYIPNQYIASYLGITRETLSRIRSRRKDRR